MHHSTRPLRLALMLLVILSLGAASWAGLLRLGWQWSFRQSMLPVLHGPLMVSGFLGTLIGLERAVALNRKIFYTGPLLSGLGALLLLAGLPPWIGQLLILAGSVSLSAVSIYIIQKQRVWYTVTMALGAVCWLTGNILWLAGWPLFQFVYWWAGFLILTIVGERLELSRIQQHKARTNQLFGLAIGLFGAGLLLSLFMLTAGTRLASIGVLALALWLWRYDIARRTVRLTGVTQYIGANLLAGYAWLALAGLAGLGWGQLTAGPRYDLWLHAIFLGFTFSMIFAHALIILPAVLNVSLPFHPIFYLPSLLLQLSLLIRVFGDLFNHQIRLWGGLLNALTILLFFLLVLIFVVKSRQRPPELHMKEEK